MVAAAGAGGPSTKAPTLPLPASCTGCCWPMSWCAAQRGRRALACLRRRDSRCARQYCSAGTCTGCGWCAGTTNLLTSAAAALALIFSCARGLTHQTLQQSAHVLRPLTLPVPTQHAASCVQVSVPLSPESKPVLASVRASMDALSAQGARDSPEAQRLVNEYRMVSGGWGAGGSRGV